MFTNPRNLKYTAEGSIDLLVDHQIYGEIPFTASPDDIEEHGRELFARALVGEFGPITPYVAQVKSPEQIQKGLTDAVQRHLDATAQQRGYDGILSLASYAASQNPPFAAEGDAGLAWRDSVWLHCYQVLAAVQAGTRIIPTAEELLAELPPMVWPT